MLRFGVLNKVNTAIAKSLVSRSVSSAWKRGRSRPCRLKRRRPTNGWSGFTATTRFLTAPEDTKPRLKKPCFSAGLFLILCYAPGYVQVFLIIPANFAQIGENK